MSWRFTPASHGGAMLTSAGRSVGGSDVSVVRWFAGARIAASSALSQPGIPSRNSKPRPAPRGWAPNSLREHRQQRLGR